MAKVEVKKVISKHAKYQSKEKNEREGDEMPHWVAQVSYGDFTVDIPLPARHLPGDTPNEGMHDSLDAMERLANALLEWVSTMRKKIT